MVQKLPAGQYLFKNFSKILVFLMCIWCEGGLAKGNNDAYLFELLGEINNSGNLGSWTGQGQSITGFVENNLSGARIRISKHIKNDMYLGVTYSYTSGQINESGALYNAYNSCLGVSALKRMHFGMLNFDYGFSVESSILKIKDTTSSALYKSNDLILLGLSLSLTENIELLLRGASHLSFSSGSYYFNSYNAGFAFSF